MSVDEDVLDAMRECLGPEFVALYLVGSHDTPRQIPGSDIDFVLVTRGELEGAELRSLLHVRDGLRETLDPEIDILPRSLGRLVSRGLGLKREGRLVGGQDIRDQIRLPPKHERDEWLTSVAMNFVSELHRADVVRADSLTYPDSDDYYFGYPDYESPKALSRLMSLSFLATAWLSKCHNVTVTDKHTLPDLYESHIGAERVPFLRGLFEIIRGELGYQLPDGQAQRERARGVCRSALEFERQMMEKL